uniref:Zinc finger PHD-type domain-containing protein n=1 Tax=Neogobius melanostomus TaxID=47308 RepID=A0A8C6U4P5_9GOBI
MPGEAAADSPENPCPVRRSGRQAKRTDKLEEFLSTAKRTFRKSAPPSLEGCDPPSQTPTDAETASEASFDGNAEVKAESPERRTRSGARKPAQRKPQSGKKIRSRDEAVVKDEASSGNEESSKDEPTKTLDENKIEARAAKNTAPVKSSTPVNKVAALKENKTRTSTICKAQKEEVEESTSTSSSSSSDESDDGGYDPNALYCICRQKHNKRFMICCDRCEEWFHGDCVGTDRSKLPKETEHIGQASPIAVSAEEKATDDLGIKGRIEKASNPTGKKKIKIFQPKTEDSVAPKCIGPGCEKNAQTDSVYCGSDCILRHAAAAMKSITEPSQKDKAKPQKSKTKVIRDPLTFSLPCSSIKCNQGTKFCDEDYSPDSDEDDEESHAEEQPPHPSTASWSSDHNYIAVTPEKTPSISTVLNKKCMYLVKGLELMLTHLAFFPIHVTVSDSD